MTTTESDLHVANDTTITSGNDTVITFRDPVSRVWIGCSTTSPTSLRVTVSNVNAPHIHPAGAYIIIEPGGWLEFEADAKNKIEKLVLAPNTAASVIYTHTVLKV